MNDNAQLHQLYVVSENLQIEDITQMDWPPYLPQLNLNMYARGALWWCHSEHQILPWTLQKLKITLLEEWCEIPQD